MAGSISPGFNLEMTVTAPPALIHYTVVTQGSPVQALVPNQHTLSAKLGRRPASVPTGWSDGTAASVTTNRTPARVIDSLIGTNIITPPPPAPPAAQPGDLGLSRVTSSISAHEPGRCGGAHLADEIRRRIRRISEWHGSRPLSRAGQPGRLHVATGPTTPPAYNTLAVGPFRTDPDGHGVSGYQHYRA